jgi:hypothetical protein
MTDAFQEREKGFERKFEFDQELAFRVQARRDKLLGLWVAARLGLSATEAGAYAQEVTASNFDHAGDGDMIAKIIGDMKTKHLAISELEISRKLAEFHLEAKRQIKGEGQR